MSTCSSLSQFTTVPFLMSNLFWALWRWIGTWWEYRIITTGDTHCGWYSPSWLVWPWWWQCWWSLVQGVSTLVTSAAQLWQWESSRFRATNDDERLGHTESDDVVDIRPVMMRSQHSDTQCTRDTLVLITQLCTVWQLQTKTKHS